MSGLAVVALGGNALVRDAQHDSIADQYETVQAVAPYLVDLVEEGWNLVVTHGNGPQVGFILRRSELAIDEVDPVPVDYAVADTQGAIGYMFVKALRNELRRRGRRPAGGGRRHPDRGGRDDPAFAHPIKPVGSFLDEAKARRSRPSLAGPSPRTPAAAGGAPSPRRGPGKSSNCRPIAALCRQGAIVVAVGGGGIPVVATPTAASSASKPWWTRTLPRPAGPRPGRRPADDPDRRGAGGHQLRHPTNAGSTRSPSRRPGRWPSGQFGKAAWPKVEAVADFVAHARRRRRHHLAREAARCAAAARAPGSRAESLR